MALIEANPEELAKIIRKGIAQDLEVAIKDELVRHLDEIVSKVARDLAYHTSASVQSYVKHDSMLPMVQVVLQFNNSKVQYCETPGTNEDRELFVQPDGRSVLRQKRASESGLV